MAVEAHHPRTVGRLRPAAGHAVTGAAVSRHAASGPAVTGAAARGLSVWVVPAEGTSPELLVHAAELVLARALQTAPEAEVHWPAAGAPTMGFSGTDDDGGTRLPPSAGPVSRMAVDLAADAVLLDGRPVPLTGVEFKVLRYLVTHLSRTVGREELQEFLDSFETPGASARSIDVYVGRVRRKLGNARHAVATVRGGGYQFVPGQCVTVRGPAEYCI
jgi:two-component system OmpR family response regulator